MRHISSALSTRIKLGQQENYNFVNEQTPRTLMHGSGSSEYDGAELGNPDDAQRNGIPHADQAGPERDLSGSLSHTGFACRHGPQGIRRSGSQNQGARWRSIWAVDKHADGQLVPAGHGVASRRSLPDLSLPVDQAAEKLCGSSSSEGHAADAAAYEGLPPLDPMEGFIAAPSFSGPRAGHVFKMGPGGLGYYVDRGAKT
eukprot:scaffold71366_cov40-Tisochrysis_lutea.AAC.1